MKVVIAGGGTGGHLFPGIAVAEELIARGHQVRFVGTARGIEARICPAEGYALDLIDVGGLKGGGIAGLVKGSLRVPRALVQSRKILRREKPQLVIGVGGYASGPLVMAAALSGIPTAILEQNSVPGVTNRMLGKLVRRVFGAFESARRFFPAKKYELVGNPVRKKVRERFGSASVGVRNRLLVVGGSQGAHAVNELVAQAMGLLGKDAPPITHQTGAADRESIGEIYRASGVSAEVRDFIDDMASAYSSAALVVARAGASTLAELTALGLPSILIPFPFAADDHQTVNAQELEAAGAAKVLVQSKTNANEVADQIRTLFANDALRTKMSNAARSLGRPNAHVTIVDALEQLGSARSLPEKI